jgi:signal transduction histidine kinase
MTPRVRRGLVVTAIRFAVALALYSAAAIGYRSRAGGPPALWLILVTTAVVATALWALRARIDEFATRVALGSGAQSYEAVHDLLRQLAATLPVDEVVPRLAEAAGRTTGGSSAAVRLWGEDGSSWTQTWPPEAPGTSRAVTVAVAHGGTSVGEIEVAVDPTAVNPFDRRLLDDLAGPAGIALSTVRLTYDLRRRREELAELTAALAASRDRLLTARRDEQHRLTAEVSSRVIVPIDAALSALAGGELRAASAAARRALEELRLIARGIFPPRLGESGLAAAIDGWLDRADLFATIQVDDVDGMLGTHPELEVCLYFCAVTTLAAIRSGSLGAPSVSAAVGPLEAVLTVAGTGQLADPVRAALTDRAEAFDGSVALRQAGVVVRLPMP